MTDVAAKVVIYEAFVEDRLEAPKHLARTVHDLYFEPKYYEEFRTRTIWSLSNAFTSAFKAADPNNSHSKSSLDESLFKSSTTEHYQDGYGKTIDRNFVLLHTFSTIALVADIETPVYSVAGRRSSEMNPLFGANPTRAQLYGIAVPLNVLSFYVSYATSMGSNAYPNNTARS